MLFLYQFIPMYIGVYFLWFFIHIGINVYTKYILIGYIMYRISYKNRQ
jgi:hypothetical protein